MAQTGYTPILIYSSSTVSQAPAVANLTNSTLGSELAINISDGKLFYKDSGNAIQVIAWKVTPTTAGGTGLTSYTAGDLLYYASGTALSKLAIGATGRWLGSSGSAPQWNAPAALTKTDDTNVTLTLGGSASTALLNAASITVGWTGTLATSRGGTGLSSFTANGVLYATSTSALTTGSGLTYDGTTLTSTGTNANVQAYATTGTVRAIIRNNSRYWNFTADSTNSGALRLRDESNDTTNTTWDSAGNMTFHISNLVQGTAAKGINFTANTALAGKTSQLLNYYEEGTWTVTLTPGTSGTIGLYTTFDECQYTRIGRMMFVSGQIKIISTSVPVGTYVRMSLPSTTADLPEIAGRMGSTVSKSNVVYAALANEGANYIDIQTAASGFAVDEIIAFSFAYVTA
jgi:hypothetical protein